MTRSINLKLIFFACSCSLLGIALSEDGKSIEFKSFLQMRNTPRKIVLWSSKSMEGSFSTKTQANEPSSIMDMEEPEQIKDKITETSNIFPSFIESDSQPLENNINPNENEIDFFDDNSINNVEYTGNEQISNENFIQEKENYIKKMYDDNSRTIIREENSDDRNQNLLPQLQNLSPRRPMDPFSLTFFILNSLMRIMPTTTKIKKSVSDEPIAMENTKVETKYDGSQKLTITGNLDVTHSKGINSEVLSEKLSDSKSKLSSHIQLEPKKIEVSVTSSSKNSDVKEVVSDEKNEEIKLESKKSETSITSTNEESEVKETSEDKKEEIQSESQDDDSSKNDESDLGPFSKTFIIRFPSGSHNHGKLHSIHDSITSLSKKCKSHCDQKSKIITSANTSHHKSLLPQIFFYVKKVE